MAYGVNWRIIEDDEALPHFNQASQNIAATASLLQELPGPTMPKDHRAHHEIRTLLKRAAVQQAKSSLSQRCELNASQHAPSERPDRDVSIHQVQRGGRPCAVAHDVNRRIIEDDEALPHFTWAS